MDDSTGLAGTLPLLLIGVVVYFVPAMVATSRKAVNRGSVGVINLLLGWTIIGWIVALAMAMGRTEKQEMRWHQQPTPPPPMQQQGPPPGWYPAPDDPNAMRWWDGRDWNMSSDARKPRV